MSDEMFKDFDIPETVTEYVPEDNTSDEISNLSKQGYLLLKENKIDEAKDAFTKILARESKNAEKDRNAMGLVASI